MTALAMPDAPDSSKLEAWVMDEDTTDQRLPHRREPNKRVPVALLAELGVLAWTLNADNYASDERLAAIRKVRGFSYDDIVSISRDTLPDYEAKLAIFYTEHLHADEEIRYVLEGSGYFDVRGKQDEWIRIACKKGDMILLPEGIYHRFTLDEGDYVKAMRLFVGDPVWTPVNRPCDNHPSRSKYLEYANSA